MFYVDKCIIKEIKIRIKSIEFHIHSVFFTSRTSSDLVPSNLQNEGFNLIGPNKTMNDRLRKITFDYHIILGIRECGREFKHGTVLVAWFVLQSSQCTYKISKTYSLQKCITFTDQNHLWLAL